jgi:hypothetical protein
LTRLLVILKVLIFLILDLFLNCQLSSYWFFSRNPIGHP